MLRPIPDLVLASGSPRRASVLRQLGLAFDVVVPEVDETIGPSEPPATAAERLARAKAGRGVAPGVLSLGFDTIVVEGNDVLGKPADEAEARAMLLRLAGRTHEVFSGIAAAVPGRVESAVECTRVRIRPLADKDVAAYVATGEPMDKAGAYGIQAAGASLVDGIEGDFFNVMGFPVQRFLELLGRFGLRYAFGTLAVARAPDAVSPVGEGGDLRGA